MFVPCQSCRESGKCSDELFKHKSAVYCWLAGQQVECSDYRERSYHGIEGVIDGVNLVGVRGVSPRRDVRSGDYVGSLFRRAR